MLTGKTAVVTGGSRGIGAAIVRKLASQGANVAVVYAGSQALAEELCAQCAAEFSGKAVAYRCDVADFTAVKDLMAQIKKEFGTVDILVNNAGVTQDGLLAMMKEESFDRVLDVDLKGAFNCIRHCAGMFLRQKHGAIVNVSSVSGMIGNPGQANYSAAKAGLIGLTKGGRGGLGRVGPGQRLGGAGPAAGAGPQGDHLQRGGPGLYRDGYDPRPVRPGQRAPGRHPAGTDGPAPGSG